MTPAEQDLTPDELAEVEARLHAPDWQRNTPGPPDDPGERRELGAVTVWRRSLTEDEREQERPGVVEDVLEQRAGAPDSWTPELAEAMLKLYA